jgi:hypothetical protein
MRLYVRPASLFLGSTLLLSFAAAQTPSIQGNLVANQKTIKGAGAPHTAAANPQIFVCVRAAAPPALTPCNDGSDAAPGPVPTDATGAFTVTLTNPLIAGYSVYLTQVVAPAAAQTSTPAVTVGPAPMTTTALTMQSISIAGLPANQFVATVTGTTPGEILGTVSFFDNGALLHGCLDHDGHAAGTHIMLAGGSAVCRLPNSLLDGTTAGTPHMITAVYQPAADSLYLASPPSSPATLTVTTAATTTTLALQNAFIRPGDPDQIAATVTSATAGTLGGTVSFFSDSGTPIHGCQDIPVVNGAAVCNLPAGTLAGNSSGLAHPISATYYPAAPNLYATSNASATLTVTSAMGTSPCSFAYNDCDWEYSVVGGVEQADLSAQNSQTEGFVDLIVRAPVNARFGNAWLRARFIGQPTNSSTQNVVSAATDPAGTVISSSLATVGYAIDYVFGFEKDLFQPISANHTRGQFTLGLIAAMGATTPLSSQSATVGYAAPAYGTNECNQLQVRFGAGIAATGGAAAIPGMGARNGYNPILPGSGTITTTTISSSGTSTTAMTGPFCVVQPTPGTVAVSGTPAASGNQITNIAFSPEDRSSFLLKYMAGVRFLTRFHAAGTSRCSPRAPNDHAGDVDTDEASLVNGLCSRGIVDLTLGQDQAITGGYLRRLVFKADAIFPIPKSGLYFFASAAIRLEPNQDQPPLILTATPISNGSAMPAAGAVSIPSPSVFVLPLKQSNRDFYRIGIALDLAKILPKLFAPA